MFSAVRLAFSWMTILPTGIRGAPTPRAAGRAMSALPLTGLLLGALATAFAQLLFATGANPLLAGIGGIGAILMLSRGMHADGLADTVDGLGSYAPPARAREIMASGSIGPMGTAALIIVLLAESAALGQLVAHGAWVAPIAAVVLSRCLPLIQLDRRFPAASQEGFGALVAGSQSRRSLVCTGALAAGCGAGLAVTTTSTASVGMPLVGALVGILALISAAAFAQHAVRRLGGISGDVLGATMEVGAAAALTTAAILV